MKVVFRQWLSWCRGKKKKNSAGNLQSEWQLTVWQPKETNVCWWSLGMRRDKPNFF